MNKNYNLKFEKKGRVQKRDLMTNMIRCNLGFEMNETNILFYVLFITNIK